MLEFPSGQEKRDRNTQKEGVLEWVVYRIPENSTTAFPWSSKSISHLSRQYGMHSCTGKSFVKTLGYDCSLSSVLMLRNAVMEFGFLQTHRLR